MPTDVQSSLFIVNPVPSLLSEGSAWHERLRNEANVTGWSICSSKTSMSGVS